MENLTSIELTRDCEAVQIPHGITTTLPAGTLVEMAQSLGGTFTVHAPGGLFRISGQDADALGLEPSASVSKPNAPSDAVGEVTEALVWEVLKSCFDPEIPLNIVDLGLIYDLRLEKGADGQSKVDVKMTLTAPGCGMGGVIAGDAQQKILMLDGVGEATVEVVWDPPWHQSMITPEGRRVLGIG
jgi:probable FeS assembly SUF system protein SufT